MKKITVYIPKSHVNEVKEAMFTAGAGSFGGYSHCSWQIDGFGQFMPQEHTSPYIGERDTMSYVEETRVEMLCIDDCIQDVVCALHNAHPYEVPAYDVVHIENTMKRLHNSTREKK